MYSSISGGAGTMDENIIAGSVPMATATSIRPATCLPSATREPPPERAIMSSAAVDGLRFAGRCGAAHALAIVLGSLFLALPVHAGRALVVDLHAIRADVALAGLADLW